MWELLRRVKPKADAPAGRRVGSDACSECGLDETAAGPLARGEAVTLCGECATSVVLNLEAQGGDTWMLWEVTSDVLEHLPPATDPGGSVVRVINAAAALAGGDPDPTRWVAFHAARLFHCERAVELLAGLGPAITDDDRVAMAYYRFLAGDSHGGLAALEPVEPARLDELPRLYYHLNRAALTLDADGSPAAIERATRDMTEMRVLLDKLAHRISREELNDLLAAERIGHGRIDLAHGRWASAAANLRQAIEKYGDRRSFIHLLLGDALAAAGEREPAEAAWREALQLAPATAFHARQAQARLSGAAPYR